MLLYSSSNSNNMLNKSERGEGNFIIWQLKYFKGYVLETLSPKLDYYNAPVPLHFKPRELLKFTLFSTLCFILTFFTVRIIFNLSFSLLLRIISINHSYSLFSIDFHVGNASNWTEGTLLFSYTIPYLVFFVIGILLPNLIKRFDQWPLKLSIVWLSFNLELFFLSNLVQGLIIYSGMGVALAWFFSGLVMKLIVVLLFLSITMVHVSQYGIYFLRCAPHSDFTDDYKHIRSWFTLCIFLPLVIGSIAIYILGDNLTYLENFIAMFLELFAAYLIFQSITEIYVTGISTEKPYNFSLLFLIPAIVFMIILLLILKDTILLNYVNI